MTLTGALRMPLSYARRVFSATPASPAIALAGILLCLRAFLSGEHAAQSALVKLERNIIVLASVLTALGEVLIPVCL